VKSRIVQQRLVVHQDVGKVADEDELRVGVRGSIDLDQQAVPRAFLDVSLPDGRTDEVGCSMTEGVNKHLRVAEVARIANRASGVDVLDVALDVTSGDVARTE
jgi:hypothetical protein